MNWLKANWMTIVVGVLTVVVIGLLLWAIPNHTEAGLQRICWHNGEAYYEGEDNLPCVPDMDLVWPQDQIPVRVGVVTRGESNGRETVGRALDLWNHQLGFEAMRLVPDGEDVDATVDWGAPIDVGHSRGRVEGGYVSHRIRSGGHMVADVAIIRVATNRLAYLITVHELGHLIGLAHDDYEASPMYPVTSDDSDEPRLRFTVISTWDRDVLRRTYPR